MKQLSFTPNSVKKIKSGLNWIKNQPKNNNVDGYSQKFSDNGFWAVIEGKTKFCPGGGDTKKKCFYKWNRLESLTENPAYKIKTDGLNGNINVAQRLSDVGLAYEGDYQGSQDNYAIEFPNSSPWVLAGDIVWMFPSQKNTYYNFIYNPGIRLAMTTQNITAATLNSTDTQLTLGFGNVNVIRNKMNESLLADVKTKYKDDDTETWKLKVYNPFRSAITHVSNDPLVMQIQYGFPGYWYVSSVECGG